MNVLLNKNDTITVVTPESFSLDVQNSQKFRDTVLNSLDPKNPNYLIIDLLQVKFVDSFGLGCLLHIHKVVKQSNGDLRLVNLNSNVRHLFEMVGLHKNFKIFNSVDDAMRSF